jgi:hypothetical protein
MFTRTLVHAFILATVLEPATMRTARADMCVLDSTVPSIPVESCWPDDKVFDLPLGGRVRVLLRSNPNYETRVFERAATSTEQNVQRRPNTPTGATRGDREPN